MDPPVPAGTVVAVIERRGRFLTAEPLFPPRMDGSAPAHRGANSAHRGGAARLTLGSNRSGGGGRVHVSAGDLVLVQSVGCGSSAGVQVVRKLGRPDVARDVIEGLLLDRGLNRGFDEEIEREARAAGERVKRERGARRDLRELPTFTIDPISARDFDDAISAEPITGDAAGAASAPGGPSAGGALDGIGVGDAIRVWVHIADVTAHVPEGSPLDREARRRSTSVYAPGAVEPMLPHALSSDACSLMPGVDRAAVTVEMEFRGAVIERAAFYRSVIRSDARLDYERVDRIFTGSESAAEPWGAPLHAARHVAAALQDARKQTGALVVDSEEPEFEFDEQGNVVGIHGRVQTESHRLIEHLMIAANEAVAELLERRNVPCLYRVHERPDPQRVERLADQLATLEVPTPPIPEHMSSTQAAELLGEMSRRVEQHLRRTGHGRQALSSLVLRSLKQAYYSPKNIGHAGLHSSAYCHFTSPIRRYPDIVCHRALLSAVGGGEPAPRAGEMVELGVWTSEREREAMIIERDSDDVARCFALERLLYEQGHDQVFAGEITGLISAGAFIAFGLDADADARMAARGDGAGEGEGQLDAASFEGMLPVRLLRVAAPAAASTGAGSSRDARRRAQQGGRGRRDAPRQSSRRDGEREWWELNEQGTILQGERTGAALHLGDAVEVRVARVDTIRGRVDLVPAL